MSELLENNIQWYTNQKTVTASFTQKKFVSRFREKFRDNPDVQIVADNKDGSICVRFPLNWVKLSPPRQVSDEQKAAAAERLRKYRQEQQQEDDHE